jgi:hypothetical protein
VSLLPALTPDIVLGGSLALLSMLTYGSCMVLISVGMRNMRSEPGSLLAAAAGVFSGVMQNIIGGLLASLWKRRTPDA